MIKLKKPLFLSQKQKERDEKLDLVLKQQAEIIKASKERIAATQKMIQETEKLINGGNQ